MHCLGLYGWMDVLLLWIVSFSAHADPSAYDDDEPYPMQCIPREDDAASHWRDDEPYHISILEFTRR